MLIAAILMSLSEYSQTIENFTSLDMDRSYSVLDLLLCKHAPLLLSEIAIQSMVYK